METYYDVSDRTVLKWIEAGMPVEPMRGTGTQKANRRFSLVKCQTWHGTKTAKAHPSASLS
ncbi:hypothetical protein [Streptomyces mirabilis]|uniref:hypothetical protein n=1 Tax=Streptomyces mirabilis TaxID=68239 RepID=UPI0036607BFE